MLGEIIQKFISLKSQGLDWFGSWAPTQGERLGLSYMMCEEVKAPDVEVPHEREISQRDSLLQQGSAAVEPPLETQGLGWGS